MTVLDKSPPRKATGVAALVIAACIVMAASPASATLFTITDENSHVRIIDAEPWGVFDWQVDGINQLWFQWFWYRIGDIGGEARIDALPLMVAGTTDTDFDGDEDTLYLKYGSVNDFIIEVKFSLVGGAPGSYTSDLAEQVTVTNYGASRDFHIFQYVDFDLSNYAYDDMALLTAPAHVTQWDTQPFEDNMFMVSEVGTVSAPDHWEIGTAAIMAGLDDAAPTTLPDIDGPSGPGVDVAWAFQWDQTIGPDKTFAFSKNKVIWLVPEPMTMIGVFVGIGGLCGYLRRRR
jgi:hypothetical protein